MNAKPATSHVALTGVYEQDYRRWTRTRVIPQAEYEGTVLRPPTQEERDRVRHLLKRKALVQKAVRTIFWGAILLSGVALTVYGLVTWA